MARKDKEAQREYHREYMRERRAWLRASGFCTECKGQDAYTIAGRARCQKCAEKHNEYDARHYARKSERNSEWLEKRTEYRRENRLCTECGKPLPKAAYPYVTCESCRARRRAKKKEARREQGILPKEVYRELGLCVRCGMPRMEGVTAWGGREIQLCEKCYADTVRNGAIGRAAYTEKNGTTWGNYQYEYERMIRHGQARANP